MITNKKRISKNELIDKFKKNCENKGIKMTIKESSVIFNTIFQTILESVTKHDKVGIVNFGIFKKTHKKARKMIVAKKAIMKKGQKLSSLQSSEKKVIIIPKKTVLTFKSSQTIKL